MQPLPTNAPATLDEAFAYIGTVRRPTVDDLRLMALLEAAGKAMYDELAAGCEDPTVRDLLIGSGLDEWKHAERCSEAVGKLTGASYPIPAREENPYLAGWVKPRLSIDLARRLAQGELGGERLYEGWAAQCPDAEVAALLRLNGGEEAEHGRRLLKIAELLAGRR